MNINLNIINDINKFSGKKVSDAFLTKLNKLSVFGGFITNKNRKNIYSFILDKLIQKNTLKTSREKNNINKYKTQIKKDCNRKKGLLNFFGNMMKSKKMVWIYILKILKIL